jgi:hypothetical protein
MNSWSDTVGDDIESVYSKNRLLTDIMVNIFTRTFNTASWIYDGRREERGRTLSPEGRRVEVLTACALFPKELLIGHRAATLNAFITSHSGKKCHMVDISRRWNSLSY